MARTIPEFISPTTRSACEKDVFNAVRLHRLSQDWTLVHDIPLANVAHGLGGRSTLSSLFLE